MGKRAYIPLKHVSAPPRPGQMPYTNYEVLQTKSSHVTPRTGNACRPASGDFCHIVCLLSRTTEEERFISNTPEGLLDRDEVLQGFISLSPIFGHLIYSEIEGVNYPLAAETRTSSTVSIKPRRLSVYCNS